MIYEILSKNMKTQKDEYTITYYLEIKRNSISIIYEFLGLYMYDYRKYDIRLNYNIGNEYLILENVMKNIQKIYNSFSETRRLSIIAKYVTYIVSKNLNIPLYKLIKDITYEANDEVIELSTNAFIKSTYRIAQKFEKILS